MPAYSLNRRHGILCRWFARTDSAAGHRTELIERWRDSVTLPALLLPERRHEGCRCRLSAVAGVSYFYRLLAALVPASKPALCCQATKRRDNEPGGWLARKQQSRLPSPGL